MNGQTTLDALAEASNRSRDAGLDGARRGDPDGFDLAVGVIRRLAWSGRTFSADTVRAETVIASNAIGAAFRHCHTQGLIEAVGYVTSRSPSRHGGVLRLWRGKAP